MVGRLTALAFLKHLSTIPELESPTLKYLNIGESKCKKIRTKLAR
jgi:hypothetical protein